MRFDRERAAAGAPLPRPGDRWPSNGAAASLELWAGPECTVNRVGDRYRDQIELTGFAARADDLDRLAGLGVRRLRFPLLWERIAPDDPERFDWRWSDARLARLRELELPVIGGLVHHGSGPRYTDLLDPAFPDKLAAYARAVAERYPHVDAWTPVNEPVTTARFSALYGLWYPHRKDDRSFVRALLQQMRGTVLAMRQIRAVNPRAGLVQTEDLGLVRSVPRLRYQADFCNARRWLSFDLLAGRVDRHHPLWRYLRQHGASEAELNAFVEEPCAADMLGINHYLTSDRFLDDRLEHYPSHMHGGNGRHAFVDVESVRVHGEPAGGFAPRLREAWERYGVPLAITEAHLHCTREEQLRWLHQAWQAALTVRGEGVDVRAVTAWSAFGAVDWNSLITRDAGHYESGLWDVRGATPRPTALAAFARRLATGDPTDHPALASHGWWQRPSRIGVPPIGDVHECAAPQGRPLLIIGATGTLGRAFARICEVRGLAHRLQNRAELDIADIESVRAALERWQPWAVINTAGFVRVDDAEHQPRQWRENAIGPAILAAACAATGVRLVTFSTDLVFDGVKRQPYVEGDLPGPLNAYGRAKLEAERSVGASAPDALVIRTAAFFGPWDRHNFVTAALDALRRGERFEAADDQVVSPTYVPDLVNAVLDLLLDGESGIWHVANQGQVSWAELAVLAADNAGLDADRIACVPGRHLGQTALRPAFAALGSERGLSMPTIGDALSRYLGEVAQPLAC